jgi:hypothetical protein
MSAELKRFRATISVADVVAKTDVIVRGSQRFRV